MEDGKNKDGKADALRRGGALNRHAERVSDARFDDEDFFDHDTEIDLSALPQDILTDEEV